MSFRIGEPPDRDDLARFPKVARQHELAARGLPVPPGVVLELDEARALVAAARADGEAEPNRTDNDPALAWVLAEFEAGHAVIARSAGTHEDNEETSGAGLGLSVAGVRELAGLAGALALIDVHQRSLARTASLVMGPTLMLIQREVPRAALLVVVRGAEPDDRFYMEVHGPEAGPEPLAEGRSPSWAGPASEWDHPARSAVEALVTLVAASEAGPQGVDLELVVDPEGRPWLVQARPLTAPLSPGWPAFRAAVAREGQGEQLRGSLILDGEHNPAPLSVAHAWVMGRLAELRPGKSGDPVVLAGWLYVRSLPRDLQREHASAEPPPMAIHEALRWLVEDALPHARAGLREYAELLARGPSIAAALAGAEGLFLAMIDAYVGRLVPARRQALARAPVQAEGSVTEHPLSLRGREDYLDVLPAVWDIASPSLADLLEGEAPGGIAFQSPALSPPPSPALSPVLSPSLPPALPTDDYEAARLLGEWDDHLFACGLAPLRRCWLYAGERLGLDRIDASEVFALTGDELVALDADRRALGDLRERLRERAELARARAELEPPSRILDGHPIPQPAGGRLRGLAIGPSFEGPIAQRRDLRDLLADAPPAGAILCIPALTAQAAVALAQLGIQAVCTEYGGALAHGVLMARELGLSALIGCHGCTRVPEGTRARLDTRTQRLVVRS